MQLHGAVISEQGQTFAVVIVKNHILNSNSEANSAIRSFQPAFPGMPIVLAGQDSRGSFTYFGRSDISRFLASIDARRIPWKVYNFS